MTRREWLACSLGTVVATGGFPYRATAQDVPDVTMERRIARIIHEFEQQGFHRTGTPVDRLSGDWLCEEVRRAGLLPARESFPLSRVDPVTSVLISGDRRIDGLPLFDGTFTGPDGVAGALRALDSDADIGLTDTLPNGAASGALGDARRRNRHKAIVCVTRGRRPGLCPSNADSFLHPFGPPVLQVSSEEAAWIGEQAKRGADVQVVAHVTRTTADAVNVTATIDGANRALAPLVIMTPRSGWYYCASERGGGLACWLEVMRALRATRPDRTVLFVASSGHELGHLGINAFVDRRPGVVSKAVGWMHFGANIGAATEPGNVLQASDDQFDEQLSRAMTAAQLSVDRRIPRGTIPSGEAEVVHRGGGRYVSIIGRNALFHHPDDRGAQAVDAVAIAKFTTAFITAARIISSGKA